MTTKLKKPIMIIVIIISVIAVLYGGLTIYSNIKEDEFKRDYDDANNISKSYFELMQKYILDNYEAWQDISENFIEIYKSDKDISIGYQALISNGREDLADVFDNISNINLSCFDVSVGKSSDEEYYVQYIFKASSHTLKYEIRELLLYSDDIKDINLWNTNTDEIVAIGDSFYGTPNLNYTNITL